MKLVANLYLHSRLNHVSDAVGEILKSRRSLHRHQDDTEGVRPRQIKVLQELDLLHER